MPFVKTRDGTSLFVRVLGRGKPVVLLHGFALDSRQWIPVIAPLLHQYQFILPDFRGHGSSQLGDISSHNQLLEILCDDVFDILQCLKISEYKLGAYSMGAMVGIAIALRDQNRIESYMHIECGPKFHSSNDWPYGFNERMKNQAVELLANWQKDPEGFAKSKELTNFYSQLVHEMAIRAFPQPWIQQVLGLLPGPLLKGLHPDIHFARVMFAYLLENDFDIRAELTGFDIPGFIVCGRRSEYFAWQGMEWMHRNWRKSRLAVFENSGHGLLLTEPRKFRKIFREFLLNPAFVAENHSPNLYSATSHF